MSDRIVRCPYTANGFEIPNESFAQTLWTSLENNGRKLALVELGTGLSVTYDELKTRATLVARRLLAQGCRRGDVIALFAPNSVAWVVAYLATCRLGAIPAGVNCLLTIDELRYQLRVCEAKFVFTTKNLANEVLEATQGLNGQVQILLSGSDHPGCVDIESTRIDEHLPSLLSLSSLGMKLDDPAVIFFSSGTTGLQKGLLLSNWNLQNAKLLTRLPQCSIVSADSPDVLVFAPFSHVTGSLLVSISLSAGLTCHLMLRFDFEEFLRQVEEKRIKRFLTVPPVATMIAKSPVTEKYKLDFVKDICVGAGGISAEVEDLLTQKFPGATIRQMYGLTETTGMICVICYEEDTRKFIRKPTSGGVPCPGTQLKVIDIKTGEALGPKETGEICVKSPSVMLGYVNNPQATAETIDKDGWLHSGDIGYYDEDGYIYIADRLKELIKYNSYQVAPAELEAVLMSHPQVADAGVVGLPDPSAGELPLAWVVRKPNAAVTESELQQFVDGKVAPYKKLRGGVHFVSAIPKTSSGKILRREIKAAILKGKL